MVNLDALSEVLKSIKEGTIPFLYKDEDGKVLCGPLTDILIGRMTKVCKNIKRETKDG